MKPILFLFLPALLLLLSCSTPTATAQDLPGVRDSVYSAILQEQRVVQVRLPDAYKPGSAEKYDVIYALDGEWNTKLLSQIQQFVQQERFMPPVIIVGIMNIDRGKDFTPTRGSNLKTSGGAPNFLSFLKKELIPYINKTYPTTGSNTLYGHSLGGLFAMYALLTEPQTFDSYLADDPSFWWDKGYLNTLAAQKLPFLANSHKSIRITGREGHYKEMGIDVMDSVLKATAPEGLYWEVVGYPNETHGSIKHKSIYDGLKYIYAEYNAKDVVYHPMNGVLLKDKPIKIWNFSQHPMVRYTTDGTEPTATSAKMGSEITLTGPGKLNIRSFSKRGTYDKTISGDFRIGNVLPAGPKPKNAVPGGVKYTYYEGEWDQLPDFKKLKPVHTGIVNQEFNFTKLPRQTHFACLFEGYLQIQKEGYYIFVLDSDDGSRLYVGNQVLIDFDGLHGSENSRTYVLPLEKGFYPIRLEYFQKAGGLDLKLRYLIPGSEEPIPVPVELLYSSGSK